jgi:hypothetical protein
MIKRLVLDVLKPHEPSVLELAITLSNLKGVSGVNVDVQEIDRKTETVKVTIEGTDIQFEDIRRVIKEAGGALHSIDQVSAGKKLVETAPGTPTVVKASPGKSDG